MGQETYKIYPNVKIGKNASIGDYVVIGVPPRGHKPGELETVIGDNAIIRSHTVIYAGNRIGDNFQTGHGVNVRELNEIRNNVSIGTKSVVEHHVRIGDNVLIHSSAFVPEFTFLEDDCWIGPHVVITNTPHPQCSKAKVCLKEHGFVTIGKSAKVGANATILPSLVIGENAVVGAGAVVAKNVPDNMLVVGNPARVIKNVYDLTCPFGIVERPYTEEPR